MACIVTFSELSSITSLSSTAETMFYLNNGQPGINGFGRITLRNLNNSLPLFSAVSASSGNWNAAYSTVTASSGNWNGTYSTVSSTSSFWNGSYSAYITTYEQLIAVEANTAITTIILGKDITFSVYNANIEDNTIKIPARCSVNFNGYKFIRTAPSNTRLFIEGEVVAPRVQIFSGWDPGAIKGTMRNKEIFPEWWGLQGSTENDGRHDIAINCAIRTADTAFSYGRTISFAAGTYYVGRPLDASELAIRFVGAGSNATKIIASKLWTSDTWETTTRFRFWNDYMRWRGATWFTAISPVAGGVSLTTPNGGACEFLPATSQFATLTTTTPQSARIVTSTVPAYAGVHSVSGVNGTTAIVLSGTSYTSSASGFIYPITLDSEMDIGANASSMFWIGGGSGTYWTGVSGMYGGGGVRYWSGVEGMTIDGYHATSLNPKKRISLISWKASVEELTIIRDVSIQYFSGVGIGGGMYTFNNTATGGNSVIIQDGGIINGLQIQNFWIKGATRRGAIPIFINKNTSVCNIKTGTIDCTTTRSNTILNQTYPMTWPLFGILIYQGDGTTVESVHLEGMGIGIHIGSTDTGGSMTTLSNIESERLMSFGLFDTDQFSVVPLTSVWSSLQTQMTAESLAYFNFMSGAGATTPAGSGFSTDAGAYLFRYSSLITIGTSFELAAWNSTYPNNQYASINISNLSGPCQYLLRDLQYGVDIPGYGEGLNPNEFNRRITRYSRANPFSPPTGTYPNLIAGPIFNPYRRTTSSGTWVSNVSSLCAESTWSNKKYYNLI